MKTLHERRVRTVVVGDLTGIRNGLDYRNKANQRLHQWAYPEFARMIEYKARLHGMTAQRVGEAYTTQTCPQCGNKRKPPGREYDCRECSFEGHRDVVGGWNILNRKYPGATQVAGAMAAPTGIRYTPNMQCNPVR